jgi:hypothetical protein
MAESKGTLRVMAVVLAALGLVAAALAAAPAAGVYDSAAGQVNIYSYPTQDILSIHIKPQGGGPYTMVQAEDGWRMEDGRPLEDTKADLVATYLAYLYSDHAVEDVKEEYGLEPALSEASFELADGTVCRVGFGNATVDGRSVYMSAEGKTYTLPREGYDIIFTPPGEMVEAKGE